MLIGVDTFDTRLDLIAWRDFQIWNGGTVDLQLKVTGGEPSFGGRNFLAGDFIWAHAEATTAMASPSPEDLSKLSVTVRRIAPIQAPQASRQAIVGDRGFLFGGIDAHAICSRLANAIRAGEFVTPSGVICVWLTVDPDAELSASYWAGWADTVNSFSYADGGTAGPAQPMQRPFRPAILCHYNKVDGRFKRDPHVGQAVTLASLASMFGSLSTSCTDYWADAPDPDSDGVRPSPQLDWSLFDADEMPSIWRFSTSFRDAQGSPADVSYSLDVVREPVLPETFQTALTFMLKPRSWQPNVPDIARLGFVVYQDNGITDAQVADMQAHPFPALNDIAGHFHLAGGPVVATGRYLKTPGHGNDITIPEAERLSRGGFEIFTVWESFNVLAGGEPTMNDPPPAVQQAFKVGIHYFDPAVHAGTEDGRFAFAYCGDTLRQPSHTPVYFCVDFDAADGHDTAPVSSQDARTWVQNYFTLIKAERDAYAQTNPDRYYLIGLYANGAVNRWAYEQGIVSHFWQSVSTGSSGNTAPNRPWYHANRWQFNREVGLNAHWPYVQGADPDADWGDGGTWTLSDPLNKALLRLEAQELIKALRDSLPIFAGLLP